jgi:hypothetical protein
MGQNTRPTQEQIDAWKEQHGEIFEFEVQKENDDQVYLAIVRRPKLKDLEHGMTESKRKGNDMQLNTTLYTDCKLYADVEIAKSETLTLAVRNEMGSLIELAKTAVKKL